MQTLNEPHNVPINLYCYSFITLTLIFVNHSLSFIVIHKKSHKLS